MTARFAFEGFVLDTRERRLTAGDGAVELNARYLDALALLVRDCGKLVPKDRFLDEVWRGVPVTDEALTASASRRSGASSATMRTVRASSKPCRSTDTASSRRSSRLNRKARPKSGNWARTPGAGANSFRCCGRE